MSLGSINGFGNGNYGLPKMDPDAYLKQFAKANGLSEAEAKAQLQQMYGDPQPMFGAQNNNQQSNENSYIDYANFSPRDMQFMTGETATAPTGFLSRFLQAFGGPQGPEQQGPQQGPGMQGPQGPQGIQAPGQQGPGSIQGGQGPQKEGDPQPHLQNEDNSTSNLWNTPDFSLRRSYGPNNSRRPQGFGGLTSQNGPQKEGDPQPHLQNNNQIPFGYNFFQQ